MKKSLLKIAVPTLAFGLVFTPAASASSVDVSTKTEVSVKSEKKAEEGFKKLTAQEKVAIKKLASIKKNITKIDTRVNQLSTATTNFYAKAATTPVSGKAEAEFFSSVSGKLKANRKQLKALQKQVNKVAKKYKGTDALAATYKQMADINSTITVTTKTLTDLHTLFTATVKAEEAKKQLEKITLHLTKMETNIAELSKSTTDFYVKAATDSIVTAKMEAEFYKTTSSKLTAKTNQLNSMKKQLDSLAKIYKESDLTAAFNKISELNSAISLSSKNLTQLHFKYTATIKADEAKKQLASITHNLSKVEANVADLTKATTDFYAKAATDPTITVKVESDFYQNTSSSLLDNTKHLLVLKKQLDLFVKNHGNSDEATAVYTIISAQNKSILAAVDVLTTLHINFKPVAPPATN